MEPFQVIGNYVPHRRFDHHLFNRVWDIRDFSDNVRIAVDRGEHVNEWHIDNHGSTLSILLWSDTYPTEILLPNNKIVSGKPNDIVLINNHVVKHRVPYSYVRRVRSGAYVPRNFARCFFSTSKVSSHEIEHWKSILNNLSNAS